MKPAGLLARTLSASIFAGCSTVKTAQPAPVPKRTYSSFDQSIGTEERYAAGDINIQGARFNEMLVIYQEISGRTAMYPATLPAPSITIGNQAPMTRTEVLQ